MATTKATFTLDAESVAKLAQTAERLGRSKSEVVREAIVDYSQRTDRLGERERRRMLEIFDQRVARIPSRAAAEVDRELADLREARQSGGRGMQEDPTADRAGN